MASIAHSVAGLGRGYAGYRRGMVVSALGYGDVRKCIVMTGRG
jgi:hypothetical protein